MLLSIPPPNSGSRPLYFVIKTKSCLRKAKHLEQCYSEINFLKLYPTLKKSILKKLVFF